MSMGSDPEHGALALSMVPEYGTLALRVGSDREHRALALSTGLWP